MLALLQVSLYDASRGEELARYTLAWSVYKKRLCNCEHYDVRAPDFPDERALTQGVVSAIGPVSRTGPFAVKELARVPLGDYTFPLAYGLQLSAKPGSELPPRTHEANVPHLVPTCRDRAPRPLSVVGYATRMALCANDLRARNFFPKRVVKSTGIPVEL